MKKRILVALSAVLVAVMLMTTVSAASPFGDVKEGDWFYDAVMYVYDNALMSGTGDGNFAPTRILTRAEMAVMLYNLDKAVYGESEAADAAPFTDVDAEWAKPAINWAYANGVITGATATTFNPNGQLNRASMAVMFTRYIESKGLEDVVDISRVDENVGKYDMFNDEFDWENSDWYWDAVHYVGEVGLMGGKDSGNPDLPNFDPTGTASRAEAATVLSRLHKFLSIPSLGAERAFAQFQANYCCTVHADVLLHYNKQGNFNGKTQATRTPELLIYDDLLDAFDERMDYDRNEYFLRFANKNDVCAAFSSAGGTGASTDVVLELVRWDGQGSYTHTVETAMNQRSWTNDNVVNRQISIPLGNWACNDTEENYAEAIQADLDAKMAEFLAYASVDGKIHMNYEVKSGGYGWCEWPREYLNLAMANAGIAGCDYNMDIFELIDDDDFFEGGAYWEQYKDIKAAHTAKLDAGETIEFTGKLRLTLAAGMKNDEGKYEGMPEATTQITLVYHPVTDRTTLLNGGYANIVIPTELKEDEVLEYALCDECGGLHYICSDATITEESLLADFKDMNQVLFNKNKYIVTGLKLDDAFKTDLASLGNLEIAAGKATFTIQDAYSMSKTLDVTVDLTVQMNTNIKKAPDGRAWDTYAETLNVCPTSTDFTRYGFSAQEELDKFVADYTCAECGTIHINLNKADHANVSKVTSAILSAMNVRKQERVVYLTTDTKTFLANNFTDATLAAKTANGGVYTKEVAIIYGSSANADVAVAYVTVDVRVNSAYGTAIVGTQTLTNEISGEQFVTCPYNLETITAFEESLIKAKVNKIVADKGVDGKYYAYFGQGFKDQGAWNDGNGTPADRVYMFSGAQTAYWTMLRYADFSDCAAQIEDDGDWWYGKFSYDTFEEKGYALGGSALRDFADKSLVINGDTVKLYFETKTTRKVVEVEVNLTIGKDTRVGFPGNTKGDAWAICKSIDEAMATEKAGIQALFDKLWAENGKDGVITVKINGYNMWHTWRPGTTNRLFFYIEGIESQFRDLGLITQYQYDGAYLWACMSMNDWNEVFGGNTSNLGDRTLCEGREFTFAIRGAISGAEQEYKAKFTFINDSSFGGAAELVK